MLVFLLLAQAAAAPAAQAAAQDGVISYPPAFFAAQQPNTALDMLNRIPGFSVDGGATIRGFEGAAGNVLIDGKRPASKTDNLTEVLTRIPAGQVERIEVIRGGAPGIDMQGKTVVANVIRKSAGRPRGLLALSDLHMRDGRDLTGVRLEGSGQVGETAWEASVRRGTGLDDGAGKGEGARIFADGSPTVRARYKSEGDGTHYTGAGSVETPLLGGRIRVNGRLFTDNFKFEEDYRIYEPAAALEQNLFAQLTDETEVGGRYNRALAGQTDLELVGLRQTRDRIVRNLFSAGGSTSAFQLDRYTVETIGRGVLRRKFGERLSLEAGGEVALNTLDSATTFSIDADVIDLPAANVQVEELRSEAFLKGTWRPSPTWTVDAGLRYESSTISSAGDVVLEKTLHFLKPRLSLAWAAGPSTQLRFRVEREVGQLNFGDFVATSSLNTAQGVQAGNPDLDPQQNWVIEAAVEQRFWESGSVVLTARHYEFKDIVDRGPVFVDRIDPVTGDVQRDPATGEPLRDVFDRPTNIGDGRRDVLILEVTTPLARLGLPGGQFKGDVTKRWSEVTDPTTGARREASGLHHLDWNAAITQDLPRWNLTWGVDAFGGFRETYYRFNTIEHFKLHTFVRPFVEWRPQAGFSIRFELHNLTQRNLRDTFYIFPGPRSAGGQPDVDDRNTTETAQGFAIRLRKNFGG